MTKISVTDTINPEIEKALVEGLGMDADRKGAPRMRIALLSVLCHDKKGKIVAGLTGETKRDWLYIRRLWVSPELQKKGVGSKLMAAAEAEAIKRRCFHSIVWTESFQAPGFYKKLGYKVFVKLPDHPIGHENIGLMKVLKKAPKRVSIKGSAKGTKVSPKKRQKVPATARRKGR